MQKSQKTHPQHGSNYPVKMTDGIIITLYRASPITFITTLVLSALTFRIIIYPFFLNPLHKIPGPTLYKISSLFTLNDHRVEKRIVKVDTLHQKYGSVVQVAPNEVSLSHVSSLKKIYIDRNLPKSQFYGQFQNFDELNSFSMLDSGVHIKRKRLMAKLYSKTSVFMNSSQVHINDRVNNVLEFVGSHVGDGIDVYELFNSLAMDVVTFFEFGSKFSTNLILDLDQREIIKSFRASSSMWFYTTFFPSLWDYAATKETKTLSDGCREWIRAKFLEAYDDFLENGSNDDINMIKSLYDSQMVNKFGIGSELFDHTAAGHETTGTSLTYCCWELSRPANQYIQERIAQEMNEHFIKDDDVIELEKLDKLPYLDAVIMETIRLHAAIPGFEPRVVDSREFKVELSDGTQVELPGGTIVSVQPYTIHRDPKIFLEPNQFIPERWLPGKGESDDEYKSRIKLMRSMIFTFGQGNRMCLGMNLAMMEMKLCIGQLYWKFNSCISGDWCKDILTTKADAIMGYSSFHGKSKAELNDVELMSMADSYTSRPIFDECWLVWNKRS
ncbi:unnamed protein product [Wickerhamomyces anomalus]